MPTVAEAPRPAIDAAEFADVGEPLFEQRARITVAQYHRMLKAGIFEEDSRVELIEGVIVAKSSRDCSHIISSDLIGALFHRLIPAGFIVSMGNPVSIVERDSEPEPDAQIVRGNPRDYKVRKHTQSDSALIVEISDSTYRMDRHWKWKTYAGAGVVAYWIVNLLRNQLEVYAEPTGTGKAARYETIAILGPDDEVPLILDGREVARFPVRDILP